MSETATIPSRRDFLTPMHGVVNILLIALAHVSLIAVFWASYELLTFGIYVVIALLAAVAHQKTMSEWVHEAAHYNLVPNKLWNDLLGTVLCGVFLGNTVAIYRAGHMRHHGKGQYFEADDTDTSFCFVRDRREFWLGVLGDVSGYNAIKGYLQLYILPRFGKKDGPSKGGGILSLVAFLALAHGIVILVLSALYRLDAYALYYASILTLYPLMNRIRAYGQHVYIAQNGKGTLTGSDASRTIDAGLLDRLFFTSHVMMYHHEHHAYPSLPFRACRVLAENSDQSYARDVNRYCRSRWLPVLALLSSLS